MKLHKRILVIVLTTLLVLTAAGLVLNSEWGSRAILNANDSSSSTHPPVDLSQFRTAQALARLAATPEEQDLGRQALQKADHEVDFAFAAALYQATFQPVPSTPQIKAIQDRMTKAQQRSAAVDADVARLTKLLASAKESQKDVLSEQLDLAKARKELIDDELNDATQDLDRAGGDPKARVQREIDDYNASEQSSGGQLDLSIVGKQDSFTVPVSNSFLGRARVFSALHGMIGQLKQAEQVANSAAASFSKRHDDLEHQLEQAQAEQSKKLQEETSGSTTAQKPGNSATMAPSQTNAAISSYHSLSVLQKRMSALDTRIHNQQDLAQTYAQWVVLAESRSRALVRGLLISFGWMVLIALAVLISDHFLEQFFSRIEPDQKNLLTLRAVLHIATRATGAILILLIILGPPSQMATVLALAGAGLTVALGDFVSGFVGWFVLMGKNGIRHGDWVEINGVSGEVIEIGLFNTVLLETGNWNDAGHPTGRRVTFANSFAIQGHYFNFSTSGQWMWDELQLPVPADQDPYPLAEEIQKAVAKVTEPNAHLAEQEWERIGSVRGVRAISAAPAINVRPTGTGFEILVRYVTRANERQQQRGKLYYTLIEVLRRKNTSQRASAEPSAAAAT